MEHRKTVFSSFTVGIADDLGIRIGSELKSCVFPLFCQSLVMINFSIKNDEMVIVDRMHRLGIGLQINDSKTCMPKPNILTVAKPETMTVRASMRQFAFVSSYWGISPE